MRNLNQSINIRFAILFLGVILLSNGCGLEVSLDQSQQIFQLFERSLFESLRGIY